MGGGLSSDCCMGFLPLGRRKHMISQELRQESGGLWSAPRIVLTTAPDPSRDLKASFTTSPSQFLGQGGSGSVFQVSCRHSGYVRAVKRVGTDAAARGALRRELQLLLELDHPHIIRLNCWFEDEHSVYLVMELASVGDLLGRGGHGPGEEAAQLFGQLMRAVRYIHSRGVVHRDLKGQNCLLTGDPARPTVKVADFGVAMLKPAGVKGERWLQGQTGTLSHMAPEVRQPGGRYGLPCDMWSAGVTLVVLITGDQPFPSGCSGQARRLPALVADLFAPWGARCPAAKLCARLLAWEPEARPEPAGALAGAWLAGAKEARVESRTLRRVLRRVNAWCRIGVTPMTQAMATATAHTLQEEDHLVDSRATFLAIDSEDRGYLTQSGLEEAFRSCDLCFTEAELAALFAALDREGSGRVSWTDWLTAALGPDALAAERNIKSALTYLDHDMSGAVSSGELSRVLGESCAEAALERRGVACLSHEVVKAAMESVAERKADLAQSPSSC